MIINLNLFFFPGIYNIEDNELFTIDTTGDEKVRNQIKSNSNRNKPLKVDEILATRSAVPAVKAKNPFKQAEMTDKLASRGENKKVDKIAKRKAAQPSAPVKKKQKVEKKSYDLWGEEPTEEEDTPMNDYIPKKVIPKKPKSEKPLAAVHIEAVTIPKAGASYNPTAEEHQKLLSEANEVEERKIEAIAKLQEQLAYRDELNQLADEVTAGQHDSEEEEAEEEEEEEEDENKKKKKESRNGGRKTRSERNKQYRIESEKLKKKVQDQEKIIRQQVDKLRQIELELDERHEAIETLTGEKSQRKLDKEKQGKTKLGKYSVPDLPIDFQLTEELSETLRQLKPEGSIFRDRYHSMQKRNIIETRVQVTPGRKYKLKEYEKRAYKNYDLNEDIKKKRSLGKK
ncbi:tumor suppressor protein Gltscr2 [Backusella circina FSU 941]|nr:tumor suppressor protein Gltscr2 [Backusella circina FSU 941]